MKSVKTQRTFFDLFDTSNQVLKVKYNINSTEEATEILIQNELEKKVDVKGIAKLERLCTNNKLGDFVSFYSKFNGFSLGTALSPKDAIKKPLLRQIPVSELPKFTNLYLKDGKWAWVIDLNKTKTLYRSLNNWLVFAEVNNGPSCLTIFLDGENAGNIFLLSPQPHFNILKPIAKTYSDFLERIAKDPSAFFKLIRAYVTIIGKDNQNYGYTPIEYVDNR